MYQSLNELNLIKIGWEQTQYLLFNIVIVAKRRNDYGIICNNDILALPTLYLLAS